jgi:hypothetical protein
MYTPAKSLTKKVTDLWVGRKVGRWTCGRMDEKKDEWMMDGWVDGWMDG